MSHELWATRHAPWEFGYCGEQTRQGIEAHTWLDDGGCQSKYEDIVPAVEVHVVPAQIWNRTGNGKAQQSAVREQGEEVDGLYCVVTHVVSVDARCRTQLCCGLANSVALHTSPSAMIRRMLG